MAKIRITSKQAIIIASIAFAAIAAGVLFYVSEGQQSSPLIIKVTTGKTLPGGIEYTRVAIINNSDITFTNVVVEMGAAGTQSIEKLPPGQSFIASPKSLEGVSEIRVTTDQGITITKLI